MTKSGITRRIDELGRIVIPKEIRNNLGIRDGEPLEIYVENNSIVIKKFSQVENIKDLSIKICNIISDICKINILISDREKILVASKTIENLIGKNLTTDMKRLIDNRETYISEKKDNIYSLDKYFTMVPIITPSDCSGLIIVISDDKVDENFVYAKLAGKLIVDSLDVS